MGPDHSRGHTLEKLYGDESAETTGDPRLFIEDGDDLCSATTVLSKLLPLTRSFLLKLHHQNFFLTFEDISSRKPN